MYVVQITYMGGYSEIYGPFTEEEAAQQWIDSQEWDRGVWEKDIRRVKEV